MTPALALLLGAGALILTALRVPDQLRLARGAALCLILSASCVGWAAPLSNGWWLGVLGGLLAGIALAPVWVKFAVFGPILAGVGFVHVGWAVVGAVWAGGTIIARR